MSSLAILDFATCYRRSMGSRTIKQLTAAANTVKDSTKDITLVMMTDRVMLGKKPRQLYNRSFNIMSPKSDATVEKLVNSPNLKFDGVSLVGSSPTSRTN